MVAPSLALVALLLAQAPTDRVLVTAAAPLDAQRLADALGAYLGEFGIRVEIAADGPRGDLRAELAGARERVPPVGAIAVIRAERGAPGAIDLEMLDLATDKALLATVPRPARDEDLYRALALKIQAMLRATLSEARARLPPESALGRLVGYHSPSPRRRDRGRWASTRDTRWCRFPLAAPASRASGCHRDAPAAAMAGPGAGGRRARRGTRLRRRRRCGGVDGANHGGGAPAPCDAPLELLVGPSAQAALVRRRTSATTPVRSRAA